MSERARTAAANVGLATAGLLPTNMLGSAVPGRLAMGLPPSGPVQLGAGAARLSGLASPPPDLASPPSLDVASRPLGLASPPPDLASPPSLDVASPPLDLACHPLDLALPPSLDVASRPLGLASPPPDLASPPSLDVASRPLDLACHPLDLALPPSLDVASRPLGLASPPPDLALPPSLDVASRPLDLACHPLDLALPPSLDVASRPLGLASPPPDLALPPSLDVASRPLGLASHPPDLASASSLDVASPASVDAGSQCRSSAFAAPAPSAASHWRRAAASRRTARRSLAACPRSRTTFCRRASTWPCSRSWGAIRRGASRTLAMVEGGAKGAWFASGCASSICLPLSLFASASAVVLFWWRPEGFEPAAFRTARLGPRPARPSRAPTPLSAPLPLTPAPPGSLCSGFVAWRCGKYFCDA